MHLSDAVTIAAAQRLAPQTRELFKLAFVGGPGELFGIPSQVAIVDGRNIASLVLFDIATGDNPVASECRQPVPDIALNRWITPCAARIVGDDRDIGLGGSIHASSVMLADLSEGNSVLIDSTLIEHVL
jgi:hypothetical protein